MIAECTGMGSINAVCLSQDSPSRGKFENEKHTCPAWKSGHHGAIDHPQFGERAIELYAAEEGKNARA